MIILHPLILLFKPWEMTLPTPPYPEKSWLYYMFWLLSFYQIPICKRTLFSGISIDVFACWGKLLKAFWSWDLYVHWLAIYMLMLAEQVSVAAFPSAEAVVTPNRSCLMPCAQWPFSEMYLQPILPGLSQSVAYAFPRVSSLVICLNIKTKAESQTAWISSRVRTMLIWSQGSTRTVSRETKGSQMSWNNLSIGQALHTTQSHLTCKQDLCVETAAHHTWTLVYNWMPHNKGAPAEIWLRQECS